MAVFKAVISGTLNGLRLDGIGEGTCDDGVVKGDYTFKNEPIPGVHHQIFNCLVITGYPSATKQTKELRNPFQFRNHRYRRTITFSSGDTIKLDSEIVFVGHDIHSRFDISGSIKAPALDYVEPLVESWYCYPESIKGIFKMVWRGKDIEFSAIAETEYYIEDLMLDNCDSSSFFRYISIHAEGNQVSFRRHQASQLIGRSNFMN